MTMKGLSRYVVGLNDLDEGRDAAEVGNKALGLARLARLGLHVPAGFCVTTSAFRAAGETGMPEEVAASIRDAYGRLGGGPVAVRSSGTAEDVASFSFAGLYETRLAVNGAEAVVDAVRACWNSARSERVRDYCEGRGAPARDLEMAVVVQHMVAARAAGVLFTVNPQSGREEEMLVEACWGVGESLVSGRVTPDCFVLEHATGRVLERRIGGKERRSVMRAGRLMDEPVPDEERGMATLSEQTLSDLAALGRALQQEMGLPVDVEWALGEGRETSGSLSEKWGRLPTSSENRSQIPGASGAGLGRCPQFSDRLLGEGATIEVLQVRPVTSVGYAAGFGEWTTADFRDGGVSSSVVSPFMWSLYDAIFATTLPRYLDRIHLLPRSLKRGTTWARVFFGRPYWNLGAVKQCLARLPGFVERAFDLDLGIEPTYAGDGWVTPVTPWGLLRALPTMFGLQRQFKKRGALNAAFAKTFASRLRGYLEPAPENRPRPDLYASFQALIGDLYRETESAYFETIYNTSNAKLLFQETFDKIDAMAPGRFSLLRLLGGLEDLSHLRPVIALWDIAAALRDQRGLCEAVLRAAPHEVPEVVRATEVEASLAQFMAEYGFHGTKELEITRPRWREDPAFVYRTLQETLADFATSRDPRLLEREQQAAYRAERRLVEAFLRRRGRGWARAFAASLDRLRHFCWWREEMRNFSSRVYDVVRRYAVAVGRSLADEGKLPDADAVFMLPFCAVVELASGALSDAEARRRVAENRAYLDSYRHFANPNEMGERHDYRAPASGPAPPTTLPGVACSPGRVDATARIVLSLDEASRLQAGDVLVTRFTDPGWTPLLRRVSGVVTETGGLLSHAAVIAREYGIPAVLGIPRVTQRIPDGAPVALDGSRGTVRLR